MAERQAREADPVVAYVDENDSETAEQTATAPNGEESGDGPVRRPLIRASLPPLDGTTGQSSRQPPIFTMHERSGRSHTEVADLPDNFGNTWDPPAAPQPPRKAGQKQGGKSRRRNRFRGAQAGSGNGQPNGNVAGNRNGRSHGRYRSRRNRGGSR